MASHSFDAQTVLESLDAVAQATHAREFFVVGSMSLLLARIDRRIPRPLMQSTDVDVTFLSENAQLDQERAIWVNSHFVEGTPFEELHGFQVSAVPASFYAGGPRGWLRRCVPHRTASGATARALDPHDCAVFKLSAGRAKDITWVTRAVRADLLDVNELPRTLDLCHPEFRRDFHSTLLRSGQRCATRLRRKLPHWPTAAWEAALEAKPPP